MPVLLSSGSNAHGQLANGNFEDSHTFTPSSFLGFPPCQLPPGRHIVSLSSGANHVLLLLEHNETNKRELWGCGDGSRGQLGPLYLQAGSLTSVFKPIDLLLGDLGFEEYTYHFISASWETTYITLTSDGMPDVLISMGADDFGDLGIGGLTKALGHLHIVKFDHLIVDGRKLDTSRLRIRSLSCGPHHVVAALSTISEDGSVQHLMAGWGKCRHGQLGLSPQANSTSPLFISIPHIIFTDVQDLPLLAVALGNQHTVRLHWSRCLSGIGSDTKGQIRDIDQPKGSVMSIGCTWNGTYAVVTSDEGEHRVFATGSSSKGQLGRTTDVTSFAPIEFPFTPATYLITQLACGSEHVLCLFSVSPPDAVHPASEVWGWGWNEHGNLGIGTTDDVKLPRKIWPNDPEFGISHVGGIWGGCGTSWVVSYP